MQTAAETLDRQFLEMRWRCLSLAADLDRVEAAAGDPRLETLRRALAVVSGPGPDRAERVQMIFSDLTAGPR